MRLASHGCAASLLNPAAAAEWAASSRLLLLLSAPKRHQALALLEQCLHESPLAQQQVLALMDQLLRSAEAVAAASQAAEAAQQAQQRAELEELQAGLLRAAALLLELRPAAFVAADVQLLQPLLSSGGGQRCGTRQAVNCISAARTRLSRALHAR